jgi:hypothetical protein
MTVRSPFLAQSIGHRCEALIEADKGFASLRIGEIHPVSPPIQCLGNQGRVLQRDPRQTGNGSERSNARSRLK